MSSRQLFFLILITVPAYKIAMLPSYLAGVGGKDMWLTALFMMLVDLVVLSLILLIKHKVGTLNFKNKTVRIICSIFAVVCGVYFVLQISVYTEETLSYLLQSFFDEGERLHIVLPIIVASCYLAYKGSKTVGRVGDIFIWFFAFSVVMGLIFNTAEFEMGNLLPVLDGNAGKKIFGGQNAVLWFCDYLPLLFIDMKDEKKSKPLLIGGGAIAVTLGVSALFGVFWAQWGELTTSVPNAFARLSGYNFISADVGKVDWVSILSWLSSCALKLSVLFLGLTGAVKYVLGEKKGKFAPVFGGIAVSVISTFFINDLRIAHKIGLWVYPIGWIIGVGIPVVCLIFSLLFKRGEKIKGVQNEQAC